MGNISVTVGKTAYLYAIDVRLTSDVGKDPAYQRITTATDYDYGQYPAAVHDTTDSLTVSLPDLGGGVFSNAGSVYFATPVGMSALHNQSMATTYTLPALSSDIYSWMVFPQRLSAVQESQLQRYMLQKSGLAAPDYLYPDNDIYGYLLDDASEILLSDPPFTAVYGAGLNDIGIAGAAGFGVGICPNVPAGFIPIAGCTDPYSDGYGNYAYSDNSVMVWVPAFYYKWGDGTNGLGVNVIDVKAYSAYADVATANAAGYALHRAFYDGGSIQAGFFIDKYQASNNGGVASSIKMGNPLSSNSAHNPFSGLTGTPTNAYHGAIVAAKTRGAQFFPTSRFIHAAMAMLSYAHAQASSSTTYCAWYGSTTNYPKGNNNNALRDTNDTSMIWVSDGYSNAGKTGSAGFGGGSGNLFAKSTHNGQNCGVADLNGNMWEINLGLTSDGTNIYVMNTAVAMKSVTSGNTLATDAWGATGIAALYTSLGSTYQSLAASNSAKNYGSASQVLSAATSGNDWNAAGAGVPLSAGTGGSNAFGSDGLWDYRPNEMCPLSGGAWADGSLAGVWALFLNHVRGSSAVYVGFRSGMYL